MIYNFGDETWIEPECNGDRRARILFPDGKRRIVRCAGTADTFFSVEMRPYKGLRGFITSEDGVLTLCPYENQQESINHG